MKNFKDDLIERCNNSNVLFVLLLEFITFFTLNNKLANILDKPYKSEYFNNFVLTVLDVREVTKEYKIMNVVIYMVFIACSLILAVKFISWVCSCINREDRANKTNINIIAHATMNKEQFIVNSEGLEINIEEVDLSERMKEANNDFDEIDYIVGVQDDCINKFKNKINNDDKYGYLGIAHTPLIMRAGYKIGDGTRFDLFHKQRYETCYKLLNDGEIYDDIQVKERIVNETSKELIVSIATTYKIENYHLKCFNPSNKNFLKFEINEFGYDAILSRKQVDEYVKSILKDIRALVREKDINKIDMVISSSVIFTFALGQALSSTYDPEIIIYHYDRNGESNKKYPWGISVFKDYKECIVLN